MWLPEPLAWDAGRGNSGTGPHQVALGVRFLDIAVVVRRRTDTFTGETPMSGDALSQDPAEPAKRIDTSKAHPARVYDVFLGGQDNYPADREAAAAALAANPRGYLDVRHN